MSSMPAETASARPPLLQVDMALARILEGLARTAIEQLPLQQAHGRSLAAPLASRLTLPEQAVSAMDGYAVNAADCRARSLNGLATLTRIGESAAGHPWLGQLESGGAVRIFTGAVLPDGADAIVLQEDVTASAEQDGASITLTEAPIPGRFIRPAGLDVHAGTQILAAGSQLSARALALALSTGHVEAAFYARPRIGILSTGDELIDPGEMPSSGQVISSNAAYLSAFVAACGASVGVHDHIISDLSTGEPLGDEPAPNALHFWKIAMRPGKPLISGRVDGIPLLGLPGNPVSSAVCALVFLRPAILHMSGRATDAMVLTARLATPLAANDQRQDYLRARLCHTGGDLPLITPFDQQDSSMNSVLSRSDALLVRPPFDAVHAVGDLVTALPIPALL